MSGIGILNLNGGNHTDMEYNPLATLNPTQEDVTRNSSIWLASRIAPAKGDELCCFSDNKVLNNASARTIDNSALRIAALLGMNNSQNIINLESQAASLVWQGCWIINNQPVIGRGHAAHGLVAALNTYNIGLRYRRGWRPTHVN